QRTRRSERGGPSQPGHRVGRDRVRAANGRARLHDRERRASFHPARPSIQLDRPRVGGQRVLARVGGLLLLGGRAGELFGPRRMFIAGVLLFAAGSLAGGLAATSTWLIASRVVQGAGGAI